MSRNRRPFRVVRNNPGPTRPPMPAQPAPSYDDQRLGVAKQFTQAGQELLSLARAAHGLDEELTKTQDAIRASRISNGEANPNLDRLAAALGAAFGAVVEHYDAFAVVIAKAAEQAEAQLAEIEATEAAARADEPRELFDDYTAVMAVADESAAEAAE